jgi:hypothetical protein
MTAILALAAVVIGIACIVGDQHISRAVLRQAEEPESGAASARVLGLILFVGGALAFLAWAP